MMVHYGLDGICPAHPHSAWTLGSRWWCYTGKVWSLWRRRYVWLNWVTGARFWQAHPHLLFIFLLPDSPKYKKAARQAHHLWMEDCTMFLCNGRVPTELKCGFLWVHLSFYVSNRSCDFIALKQTESSLEKVTSLSAVSTMIKSDSMNREFIWLMVSHG